MKFLILLISLAITTNAKANDFYDNLLFSDEIKKEDAAQSAINEAKKLSRQNLKQMKLKSDALQKPKPKKKGKETDINVEVSSAPFGLLWGASVEKIKSLGIKLKEHTIEDYPNTYEATYLPKPVDGFSNVYISFGDSDTLWRVLAYGTPKTDDAKASEVLSEYKKFYTLLEKKYGNASQTYIGYKKTIVEIVNKKEVTKQVEQPIGNDDFLAQLVSGEATLYAVFEGNDVGVALSVNATAEGKTFIAIDYKNANIIKKYEQQIFDAL